MGIPIPGKTIFILKQDPDSGTLWYIHRHWTCFRSPHPFWAGYRSGELPCQRGRPWRHHGDTCQTSGCHAHWWHHCPGPQQGMKKKSWWFSASISNASAVEMLKFCTRQKKRYIGLVLDCDVPPPPPIVILSITCLQLASFAPVDLLFGGSPCNEISIANPARKGLEGMAYHIKYIHVHTKIMHTVVSCFALIWSLSHPSILGVTLCFCTGSYAAAGRRFLFTR